MAIIFPFGDEVPVPPAEGRGSGQAAEVCGAKLFIEKRTDHWIVGTLAWATTHKAAIELALDRLRQEPHVLRDEALCAGGHGIRHQIQREEGDAPGADFAICPSTEADGHVHLEAGSGIWRRGLPRDRAWMTTPLLTKDRRYELVVRGTYKQDGQTFSARHPLFPGGEAPWDYCSVVFDDSHVLEADRGGRVAREHRWRVRGNDRPLRIRFNPWSSGPVKGGFKVDLRLELARWQPAGASWQAMFPRPVRRQQFERSRRESPEEWRRRRVRREEIHADDQKALLAMRLKKRRELQDLLKGHDLPEDVRDRLETEIDILFSSQGGEHDDEEHD